MNVVFLQESKTVKAMVINQFGNPSVFEETDLATPEVLSHQVLIQVAATSVNPVDCKIRQGILADIAPNFPAILHGDVAGTIAAVGAGVDRFRTGDEVYACAGGVIHGRGSDGKDGRLDSGRQGDECACGLRRLFTINSGAARACIYWA